MNKQPVKYSVPAWAFDDIREPWMPFSREQTEAMRLGVAFRERARIEAVLRQIREEG